MVDQRIGDYMKNLNEEKKEPPDQSWENTPVKDRQKSIKTQIVNIAKELRWICQIIRDHP